MMFFRGGVHRLRAEGRRCEPVAHKKRDDQHEQQWKITAHHKGEGSGPIFPLGAATAAAAHTRGACVAHTKARFIAMTRVNSPIVFAIRKIAIRYFTFTGIPSE